MKVNNPLTEIYLHPGSKYYITSGMFYRWTVWTFVEETTKGELIFEARSGDNYTKSTMPKDLYLIKNRWIRNVIFCNQCVYESK